MPLMSTWLCTARWRNDEPLWMTMPACSASGRKSGWSKSIVTSSSDSRPSMLPALWEMMCLCSNGTSSSAYVTMLQR